MIVKEQTTHYKNIVDEIISGLSQSQKTLPTKLFYDEKGSQLFDEICELDEYYPTRTEIKILDDNIEEITSELGNESILVELGSGSSIKIRLLLDHLPTLSAYVPVDISKEHLIKSADCLKADYPGLKVYPLVADYTKEFQLPEIKDSFNGIDAFYPGSTIGNFTPEEARSFLKRISTACGVNSGLLIGVDLKKDVEILNAAYNDKKGITAAFNLNILNHINRLTGADFNSDNFNHHAFFNEEAGRIEMHLVSNTEQQVRIGETTIGFNRNDDILTEYSYKYSLQEFAELVRGIYNVEKIWIDDNKLFSVQFLRAV